MSSSFDYDNTIPVLDQIKELYKRHYPLPFPQGHAGKEIDGVDLIALDMHIAGTVSRLLGSSTPASTGDIAGLSLCYGDVCKILPHLSGEAYSYFALLQQMSQLMLLSFHEEGVKHRKLYTESKKGMVSFRTGKVWFNYRAAGIAMRVGPSGEIEVLATTETHLPFCYLPGGRVEMGEDTQTALLREIREEIGLVAQIERLLFVVENFHPWNDGVGTQAHEIGLYYAISFPDNPALYQATEDIPGCDEELDLVFCWKRPADISTRPLVPAFLREAFSCPLPEHPVHILNREP